MPNIINLPGHVRCTREKYNAEMTRLKSKFGSTLPANWDTTLTGEAYDAAYKYANNIYFCEDTSEIFYREVCYGFSEASQNAIKALEDAVFTLSFSLSAVASISKVVGDTVNQTWKWTIQRNGVIVTPTRVTVNGTEHTDVNKLVVFNIKTNSTYNVVVYYNNQTVSFSLSIKFYHQRYYGVLSKNTGITAADIKTLTGKSLATYAGLSETTFNCSGGKYPVIVLPVSAGNSVNMNVIVNGLLNTDFTKTSNSFILDGPDAANYIVIVSNGIQYGSALKIKVTN